MSKDNSNNNGKINRRNNLSSNFSLDENFKKNIDAIKNRGTNQALFSPSFSIRKKENTPEKAKTKESELPKKDSLEENKELKESQQESTKKGFSERIKSSLNPKNAIKNAVMSKTPLGQLKEKIQKLKMSLIMIGILGAFMMIMFLVGGCIVIFDTYFNGISMYFGIPETDSHENMSEDAADGILTNQDYIINPETNENYTPEELVTMLKNDNACNKITFWSGIGDWFDGLDGRYNDVCSYLRYIESYITEKENEYYGLKLDRSLIIGTIFYGYATQPNYSQYEDALQSEDIIFGNEYYKTLMDVLENGKITKNDIETMIDNSIVKTSYSYYTWSVTDKKNAFGNVTSSVGRCMPNNVQDARYSLKKWQIFMRFGEEAARIWEEESLKYENLSSSDEECTGQISESELLDRILTAGNSDNAIIHDSVYEAIEIVKQSNQESKLDLFEQSATTNGHEKDIFEDYENGEVHVKFDYRNGFVYNKFPIYKEAIENNNININYDEAITPKEIETTIQLIINKKSMLNKVLLFEDQDDPYKYYGDYDGYSSVITNAYCKEFLSAPLDSITIQIKDCDGKELKKVSMKEYIIGVAYGEVSDKEDDYVKAQMLAAISYTLNRRNNYTKGKTFTMRSGTCDQVFCEMDEGCYKKKSNITCTKAGAKCDSFYSGAKSGSNYHAKASNALISKYSTFYEEVKDFLVIDKKTGKIANTSYINLRQNEWYEKAKKGMNFTQIIKESYAESGKDFDVIQCSKLDTEVEVENTPPIVEEQQKYGNIATSDYPEVSQDKGKFYGYSYNDEPTGKEITINPQWINNNITTISSNCAKANWDIDYNVNIQASKNYQEAFKNICKMLTTGVKISSGTTCKYKVDDLQGGETFAQRKTTSGTISDISYGITQDWNYYKKYIINGKTYQPYGNSRNLEEYLSFINTLGSEENCENINYILYKYAYEPAGFQWGGNWGRNGNNGEFNAMHFYIGY